MTYLSPLLAILAGVIHAGLAPVIAVAGVHPNLVLVAVVVVTCLFGFSHGITWAFVAGLTANLLVGDPLGSVPLVLLLVAAGTAGGLRFLGGLSLLYPVIAAAVGSVIADAGLVLITGLVGRDGGVGVATGTVVAAAALNGLLAGGLFTVTRAATARWAPADVGAW